MHVVDFPSREATSTVILTFSILLGLGLYICYLFAVPFLPAIVGAFTLAVLFAPLDARIRATTRSPGASAAATVVIVACIVVIPAILGFATLRMLPEDWRLSHTFVISRRAVVGYPARNRGCRYPGMATETLPKVTVAKDPTCGCCSGWVDHLRQAGFAVEVVETPEINRVKVPAQLGVPSKLAACHTGEVARYVRDRRTRPRIRHQAPPDGEAPSSRPCRPGYAGRVAGHRRGGDDARDL